MSDFPSGGGGVTDHAALTGLLVDDHSQYPLILGRSGSLSFYGGTDALNDLILYGNSNDARPKILILGDDDINMDVGTGKTINLKEQGVTKWVIDNDRITWGENGGYLLVQGTRTSLYGSATASEDLELSSTAHATKGDIILTGLPAGDPTVAGALWNDAGVVKISAG